MPCSHQTRLADARAGRAGGRGDRRADPVCRHAGKPQAQLQPRVLAEVRPGEEVVGQVRGANSAIKPAGAMGIDGLRRAHFKTWMVWAPAMTGVSSESCRDIVRSYFLRSSEFDPLSSAFLIWSRMAGSVLTMAATVICSVSPVHGLMSRSCCFASARNSASCMVASN